MLAAGLRSPFFEGARTGSILIGIQRCCSIWRIATARSAQSRTPSTRPPWGLRARKANCGIGGEGSSKLAIQKPKYGFSDIVSNPRFRDTVGPKREILGLGAA